MASQNRGKMRKQEFVILKDRASGQITNVIAPNGLQIGLNDEEFQTNLVLNGPVVANDGTSWLVAGDNVTLSTGSNNAVTISANAGSAYAALTGGGAEYGIKTFTYDGTSAVVVKVDLDTIYGGLDFSTYGLAVTPSALDVALGATPEDDDLLIIEDVSQSSLKTRKITVANLMAAASSLSSLGNPLSFGDGIYDSVGAETQYDNSTTATLAIRTATNGGLNFTSQQLYVDPSQPAAVTSVDGDDDYAIIYSDTEGATRKVALQYIADLATVGATTYSLTDGDGITDFTFDGSLSSVTVAVEAADSTINVASAGISVASVPNTLDAGDGITTFSYDGGTSSVTVSVDLDTDGGLGINSSELAIDYSTLTTAGITTSDYLSFYDIDRDPNTSKINLGDFVDFLQGAIDWSLNSGDPNAQYLVLAATASLTAERVITPSNGLTATDGGAGNSYTLGIDYSGGGNLISAASDGTGISVDGSNDKLLLYDNDDATVKYITANQIAGTAYTAGDGLDLSSYEFSADLKSGGGLKIDTTEIAVDNSVVATLTGSQFSGNVGITGSLGATSFLLVGTPSGPHSIQIDAGGLTSGSIAFSKSGGDPDAAISLNSNEHLELSSLLSNKDI
ncbi:hypothetical protein CL634_11500, partial [bacterium]|nr:hypothetical protein [bacterium]